MKTLMLSLATIVCLAAAAAAGTETFVVTFDGPNEGNWTYGGPFETIETTGGNPGAFLHSSGLDTYAPRPRTSPVGATSLFTGDYRARGVSQVAVDLILFDVDFSAEGRALSVILYSDNGTAGDFSDDWGAYFVGPENVPLVGDGWKSFQFAIPSQETSLPAGWNFIQFGPGSPPSPDWNDVITDVDRLEFHYGDPTFFYIFQMWDLGLDNASITYEAESLFPCADGAVNAGCGARENVLFLNEQTGGADHLVEVATTTPLSLAIVEPTSRRGDGQDTAACVYAWLGEPGEGDTVVVPKGLGDMCFGPYLIATKNPKKIWNGIGFPAKLGEDNGPGAPPVIGDSQTLELFALPGGLGRTLDVTFQGLIEDDCSQGTVDFSVTNGLIVRIGP